MAHSQEKDNRVRLNKLIAESGLASRRAADKIIEEGRVSINGKKIYELGTRVEPGKDKITVDGKNLRLRNELVYAMLHKPLGVLTTMDDPLNRPTIKEFVEHLPVRLFPVGRLDWNSEGLLLLTNDGDWANRITHPKDEITKTYLVKIDGQIGPEHIRRSESSDPFHVRKNWLRRSETATGRDRSSAPGKFGSRATGFLE